MALIPATITVNFISNYAGPHRVCWRMNNVGPYNCTTVVTCLGGGNPCQAIIAITVDNETCNSVIFDGYVQAACEVEGSLSGRIFFSTTFTPNPACDSYNILCNAVAISSITINNVGSGYNPGLPPAIIISGGGGSGATANVTIGNGGVKTETITNGGSGYDSGGSSINFAIPAVTLTGVGTGAVYTVTIGSGIVTGLVLTSPGSGYAIGDTFTFGNIGGTGANTANITINTINTGEVQSIAMVLTGSGYSSQAIATIDPSPGFGGNPIIQATATPVMGSCPEFVMDDCEDTTQTIPALSLGQNFNVCSIVAPTPPLGYNVTQLGCCYDCVNVTFTATSASVSLVYVDCVTRAIVQVTLVGPSILGPAVPLTVCAVDNSWYWTPGSSPVTVLVGAAC